MTSNEKRELLMERLLELSLKTVQLLRKLPKTSENLIFAKQVIRSSSSIGANYSEAIYAYSTNDFIHCLNLSRKEANETVYWLKLLSRVNKSDLKEIEPLLLESQEILKMLISSVKTARVHLLNKS